jgi:hypothetical protein
MRSRDGKEAHTMVVAKGLYRLVRIEIKIIVMIL